MGSTTIETLNPAAAGRRAPGWLRASLASATAEVWAKFLLALVGLGLAFGAAIFSTAWGEAGHVWASVILASVALVMAVFVGLVTVPYLARRVAVERLRQTFHYEVTRVGVVYVLVTLVIGIAALNTGNNLLYIVVAAMLAAILVSGVLSALVLRGLELDVRLPEQVFAGRAVLGRIALRNSRRVLPSFSIRVVPARKEKKTRKQWHWEPTTFVFPLGRSAENQWLRLRDYRVRRVMVADGPAGIFEGMVYFPYLPPRAELAAELELIFDRRGRYCESSFGVATKFPFAFLTKTRHVALQREILVYPPVALPEDLVDILPRVNGEWESFVRGRGSDLYRIREYLPEDSARHVDWKATAKSGSLKVREFSREDERKLCIVFDNPEQGAISEAAYEKAVNLAASLAWYFSTQQADVSFVVTGEAKGKEVNQFLASLAVIQPRGVANPLKSKSMPMAVDASLLQEDVHQGVPDDALRNLSWDGGGEYKIVITGKAPSTVPPHWLSAAYFVFLETENLTHMKN